MNPCTSEPRTSILLNPQKGRSTRPAVRPVPEDELLGEYTPELRNMAYGLSRGAAHLRDDLFQEGAIGLVNAARRFDPAKGAQFPTLARRHMRGRMLNYLRKECRQSRCVSLQDACYCGGE